MRDFIDRFIHDRPFADLVMLCAGAFGNLAFAALNAILWLVDPSPWHGALTVYFIALVVMSSLVQRQAVMENRRGGVRRNARGFVSARRFHYVPVHC